jgi:membrane protease YdiL (CAAX protease family)
MPRGWRPRIVALAEVSLAFTLMHLAFRAFKRFTSLGQLEYRHDVNFSPGAAMILIALGCLALRRRRPEEYGITLHPLRCGVNAGLTGFIVFAVIGALALACGWQRDPTWSSPRFALVATALNVCVAIVTLGLLHRWGARIERFPLSIGVALLLAGLLAPLALRLAEGRPVGHAALTLLGLVVGAALGEELFFRGYVQSRLNEAFGRPWSAFGVPWGPGLLIASAYFGLIHVLNPCDYFRGQGHFAWWHGLFCTAALLYGFLRERTGSIVAPIVLHALIDLAARMPALRAAP